MGSLAKVGLGFRHLPRWGRPPAGSQTSFSPEPISALARAAGFEVEEAELIVSSRATALYLAARKPAESWALLLDQHIPDASGTGRSYSTSTCLTLRALEARSTASLAVSGNLGVLDCAPHFERMLYDNPQLARVYLHAWQVTGNEFFRTIAQEILDYVVREMTYVGANANDQQLRPRSQLPSNAADTVGSIAKVLTSWNGRRLAAFAKAARALDRDDYSLAAERNADFLLRELRQDNGRLLRTWKARPDPASLAAHPPANTRQTLSPCFPQHHRPTSSAPSQSPSSLTHRPDCSRHSALADAPNQKEKKNHFAVDSSRPRAT
jgi:hypothetical protein